MKKHQQDNLPPLIRCRCGGLPTGPYPVEDCKDRWKISCAVNTCHAYNIGQGLRCTIEGWNRLSQHLFR